MFGRGPPLHTCMHAYILTYPLFKHDKRLKRGAFGRVCGMQMQTRGKILKLVRTHNDYLENIQNSRVHMKFRSDKIETYNLE